MNKDILGIPLQKSSSSNVINNYFEELYHLINGKPLFGSSLNKYVSSASHEYRSSSVSEIHILTNDIKNYDCSFLMRFSIFNNILKGIKYYYYITEENEGEFLTLKVLIKELLIKGVETLNHIDRWIRAQYYENSKFTIDFLNELVSSGLEHTLKRILGWKNIPIHTSREQRIVRNELKKFSKTSFQFQSDELSFDKLIEWIRGESYSTEAIKQEIEALNNIGTWLQQTEMVSNDANSFLKMLNELNNLMLISDDILNSNLVHEEAFDFYNIPKHIKEWIKVKISSANIIDDNLNLILINEKQIKPYYNFCLILNLGGAIDGASWYAISNRDSIDDMLDNYVLLYLFQSDEQRKLKQGFDILAENYKLK